MRIAYQHSHLNGLEWILYHEPDLWKEVEESIQEVDGSACKTYVSQAKKTFGMSFYSPDALNKAFKNALNLREWNEQRTKFWVTSDVELTREVVNLDFEEQERLLKQHAAPRIRSATQTDFVKNQVAIEIQFGHYTAVAFDIFVKHMAFFVAGDIKVGIEILPTKRMLTEMSSGPWYYEAALHSVIRQGRGVPAVPLVLVGLEED